MSLDYVQPDFYRFNEDSLILVNWAQTFAPKPISILDLGCGSGVMGIEYGKRSGAERLVLLEAQEDFRPFIDKNVELFVSEKTRTDILIQSFADYTARETFDVILCNPPYYLPDKGRLAADLRRRIARSFVLDSWEILLSKIELSLSENGSAFIVLKNDEALLRKITSLTGFTIVRETQNDLMLLRLNKNRDQ